MNEASRWRHDLAQQLVPHYSANSKVTAVSLGGSTSQGCADRFSDIDLTVFCTVPPTGKERRAILKRARGRRGHLLP
jgi:predicted nucleotidyltransferase